MRQLFRISLLMALVCIQNAAVAQITILDESILTQASFNAFTPINVTGFQSWYFNSQYGAICNGFSGGQVNENEDWLVSPIIDLSQMDNVKASFQHTRGNAAVMNVGVVQGWYKAYATANFTGDPATTQWYELSGINHNIAAAWQYVNSGELQIPEAALSATSRIAFRYYSSATESATWEIKNVKVTGDAEGGPGSDSTFKITNWNIEWLGCDLYGPSNENLQMNNTVSAMQSMNSDIYCIQEVSNTIGNPTIETLVNLLGSEQWAGSIAPSNTGDCNQRQGIIYKKSKVQLVSASEMSSGAPAQGNSYQYNWSGGRYPALYNVNLISGSNLTPVSIVNIHAKVEDGAAASYTRRLGASQALKTILDNNFGADNVIIVGDFNDYLIGTTSSVCQCTESPYQNFISDSNNYNGISNDVIDVNISWGIHPLIENMIISNELFSHYVESSTVQEASLYNSISNFYNTTSNHLPVSSVFQFSTLGKNQLSEQSNLWTIYPNPAGDQLKIASATPLPDYDAAIYDLTGRQVAFNKLEANTFDISNLPGGIYIIKIGENIQKFVKK